MAGSTQPELMSVSQFVKINGTEEGTRTPIGRNYRLAYLYLADASFTHFVDIESDKGTFRVACNNPVLYINDDLFIHAITFGVKSSENPDNDIEPTLMLAIQNKNRAR